MSKSNLPIRGAGGGGKSGSGSVRVAQEARDSLRSKQFARVIDLVSEGEIEGLVNGLESVYLDDTPIQNPNGTLNFDGVTLATRVGTQSQSHIPGFPAVESEVPVGVEVTKAAPIVRTITDSDNDYVRVTVSVPMLTKQNTTNGDITGTSVRIAIDIQSNGSGWVAQELSTGSVNLSVASNIASSRNNDILGAMIKVDWAGGYVVTGGYWFDKPVGAPQSLSWRLEYRKIGSANWIALKSGKFSGTGFYTSAQPFQPSVYVAPTASSSVSFSAPSEGRYEFRLLKLSGTGTLTISGRGETFLVYDDITGKTSSRYQRAYRLPLTGEAPWDIRVRRITADSTSQALQNKTYWDSYTEILDQKLRYPNSALMAMSVDSERFSRIPVRAYEIRGIIIQVPTNYDPITREYTGVWDGTFTPAWSNNPAWVFYDIITNDRYGVGQFIPAELVDKWALYEIAQYCDELVSDGKGGQEPRFTCNVYLQTREDAYRVIQSLASVFRGIAYYSGGLIVPVQDSPKEPVALFTKANVIDGTFNYSGSSGKVRHTVALVSWNDPEDRYRQAVEYVEDNEGISRLGIIQTEVDAIGCTSRAQANRFGRAILFSERMETETVTFKIGLDGSSVAPGDIIQTSDEVRSGERLGGRLLATSTINLTLDVPVTIDEDVTYTIWCVLPDGTVESREISTLPSTTSEVTVSEPFSDTPKLYSIWVIGSASINPETWRVINIEEGTENDAQITALEYRNDKYDAIENGVILEDRPISGINASVQDPVTDVVINEELYLISQSSVGTSLSVSWAGNANYYEVEYKRSEGNYERITTSATSVDIRPVIADTYTIRITAVNAIGVRSTPSIHTKEVYGLTAPPNDVTGFAIQAITGNAHFTFDPSTDLDVIVGGHLRIRHSKQLTGATWSSSVNIGQKISGGSTLAVLPLLSGTYLAKWVDSSGNESVNAVSITTTAPSIINMNVIEVIEESPDFLGLKTNVGVSMFGSEPALVLTSSATIDSFLDPIDDWGLIDTYGGIEQLGYYYFNNSVDLGEVVTSTLTAELLAISYREFDLIDEWGLIDDLDSIDGNENSQSTVTLQVSKTDDDPASTSAAWSDWADFNTGAYEARAFEFRAKLETESVEENIAVIEMGVEVDMPDKIWSEDDLIAPDTGLSVTYPIDFQINPAVGISAQGLQTGDYYELTNKSKTGFDILFRNSSGTAISRTFDYIARGY